MARWSRCLLLLALLVPVSAAFAYDSKTLFENDRLRVTRIELPKDGELPSDNTMDAITIQLGEGRTSLIQPGVLAKSGTGSGQVHYFAAGTKHSVKNIGKETVSFIQVQFLRPSGKYVAFETPPSHYCNPGAQKECVREQYLFCTDRLCAESVSLDPGAISTQHTHDADYMVIATTDFMWRNEPLGKAAFDEAFKAGDVKYIEAGGTHRLNNTGGKTARMFVIQFK